MTYRLLRTRVSFVPALSLAALLVGSSQALAQSTGDASSFAIVGATTVTVAGTGTVITGDVGVSPGTAITGTFVVTPPFSTHNNDQPAIDAQTAATALFTALSIGACTDFPGPQMDGASFGPGIHCFSSSADLALNGNVTLTGAGIYIFRTTLSPSTLIANVGSTVTLNGVDPCNVFWQVGSSATLNGATFAGNVVASTSVGLGVNASLTGRAFANTGAVTLDGNNKISGCSGGTLSVTKTAVGGDGTFNFTGGLGNFPVTTIAGSGTQTFSNVAPGTYTIAETTQTGWVQTSSTCSPVTVSAGGVATCAVVNTAVPGSLVVTKTTVGGNGVFAFSATGGLGTFSISTAANTGTQTFSSVAPGTYAITETAQTGWVQTSSTCGSVTVSAGVQATCAVVNTLAPGGLVVTKTTVGGNGTFNFSGTGGIGAFSILTAASTGARTFSSLPAGSYSITETVPAGWAQTSNSCSTVTVPAGGVATCTIVNTKSQPAPQNGLSLSKTANPTTYTAAGQVIVYSYVVLNTGTSTLAGPFTVTDDKLGTFVCGSLTATLVSGASLTCTKNYTTQASDLGTGMLPTGVVAKINTGTWLTGVKSSQDTKVTGAGPMLPNGTYPAWCIQDRVITDLHNQFGTLYSTIGGSLPSDVASLAWGKVNYLLNHKIQGPLTSTVEFLKDVQTAVWVLTGELNPEFGVSAAAQQMINAANANAGFVPGPGDVVAVIIYSDGMHVSPGSIQESILEIVPFKSIVNHATVRNVAVKSAQVQATVNQIRP